MGASKRWQESMEADLLHLRIQAPCLLLVHSSANLDHPRQLCPHPHAHPPTQKHKWGIRAGGQGPAEERGASRRGDCCLPSPTLSPTDPVGQSWPRGTGSVGDSVGEGAAYVNAGACRGESRAYSNGAYSLPLPCLPICRLFAGAKETHELACGTRRWQAQVARASARARHALTPCASHSAQPTRHTHAHTRTTGGTGRGRPPLDNLEAFDDARMDATVEDVLHVHRRDPVVTLLLHFCDPPFQPPLQLLPHLDQRAQ
jgi:hypothetical protein